MSRRAFFVLLLCVAIATQPAGALDAPANEAAAIEDCPAVPCDVCLGESDPAPGHESVPQTASYVDLGPFYNTGGHYSSAYVVALAAGMSVPQATELSYWTEYPDRDGRYDAIKGMVSWDLGYSVQVWVHSLRGGSAAPVRASLENLLSQRMGKPWAWGLLVHALGDSYAHTYPVGSHGSGEEGQEYKLYSWPFGHAFAGHEPDIIANHKPKYRTYLEALYRGLQYPGQTARRCLLDRLEELVECPQWDAETDEVGALNCFASYQGLPKRPLPFLDLTLSQESVDGWIEMVKLGSPAEGEE